VNDFRKSGSFGAFLRVHLTENPRLRRLRLRGTRCAGAGLPNGADPRSRKREGNAHGSAYHHPTSRPLGGL